MNLNPHPFTLRQLQYVIAVAESLSFSKAAARCHVSQPSLSAQLAQVEHALGVRLFERDRRAVVLTAAGRDLVARARTVLLASDDLVAVAQRAQNPLEGTLKLGVIPTLSPYLLPAAMPVLRRSFARLTTLWVEDRTPVLMRQLNEGVLDAALLALEADLGPVESATVAHDAFVLATRRDDPLGTGGAVRRSELRDIDMLLLDDGHCFRDQVLSFCARVKAHEVGFRATSLSTLTQMVAGGAGATLLPEVAVRIEAPRARLKVRHFESPAPSRTVALVWRPGSPLASALKQVTAALARAWPAGSALRGQSTD